MSEQTKMMETLELTLTREQSYNLRAFWEKHGSEGKAMLAQPLMFSGGDVLKIGVLSKGAATDIARIVEKEKARAVTIEIDTEANTATVCEK